MALEALTCPECDGPMVSRVNRDNGQRFWGCKNFPECRGTRNTDGEASRRHGEAPDAVDDLPSTRQRRADHRRWR